MTLPPKQTAWSGRPPISTFVHSLHLLDLDLHEDWPGISVETFASKSNLQQRLRSVEWSLYRLFELYDSRLTKDKLLPFFPPTTSLQSINLRAAIFRQLTELKKDGRLGQNVVLRRTMLDECKGNKFEELLAAFSMLVLRKFKKFTNDSFDFSKIRPEHLFPLVISHRKAIEKDLTERRQLSLKAKAQQRSLQATIERLTAEESELKRRKVPKLPDNAESLHRTLRENWVGDVEWVDTILNGELPNTLHNDNVKTETNIQDYDGQDENRSNLLNDLQSRVVAQNAQLAHWQHCLQDLQRNQNSDSQTADEPDHLEHARGPKFSQHLTLDSEPTSSDYQELSLSPQHAALFQSLERELTQNEAPRALNDSHHQPREILRKISKNPPSDSQGFIETGKYAAEVKEKTSVVGPEASNFSHGHEKEFTSQHITQNSTAVPPQTNSEDQTFQPITPPRQNHDTSSLTERTQASLAEFTAPETPRPTLKRSASSASKAINHTTIMTSSPKQVDKTTLFQRTRESMSLLTSAVEDTQSRRKSGLRRSFHSKSKSVNLPAQNRKLEQAWSEESAATKAARDDLDVGADYESVFMSRPKLAMSPNLSPQRNNLFEEFLEEGMKNLTIEPTS